jgi:predicted site-specific integrase-resolvase
MTGTQLEKLISRLGITTTKAAELIGTNRVTLYRWGKEAQLSYSKAQQVKKGLEETPGFDLATRELGISFEDPQGEIENSVQQASQAIAAAFTELFSRLNAIEAKLLEIDSGKNLMLVDIRKDMVKLENQIKELKSKSSNNGKSKKQDENKASHKPLS